MKAFIVMAMLAVSACPVIIYPEESFEKCMVALIHMKCQLAQTTEELRRTTEELRNTTKLLEDKMKTTNENRNVVMQLVVNNTVSPVLTTDPDAPMNIWKLSDDKFTKRQKFAAYSADGTVTIQRSGFYMIYANVQVLDPARHENWYWYTIKINGREFLRCTRERGFWTSRIQACLASGGVYLSKGVQVTFHSAQTDQEVTPGSLWGLAYINKGSFFRKQFDYWT